MENKYEKISLGIIATVLLGAIGSGFWERIIGPFSDTLISTLAYFFSYISKTYANSLYFDIGKGGIGILGVIEMPFYAIFSFIMIILPIVAIFSVFFSLNKLKKSINKIDKKEKSQSIFNKIFGIEKGSIVFYKRLRLFIWVLFLPLCLTFSVYYISNTVKEAYTYDVVVYIEQSLEIIAPFINDSELKLLKSEYRQINNREKFKKLNDKIKTIAKQNNIELREVSLIKID